jgi:ABC-type multidrug transport system ATPase subunit
MSEYALEVRGLCKARPGSALKDVSLALPSGHVMGLVGPNGAGKTTIIKLVMNLVSRTAGEIRVFGLDTRTHEVEVRSRIGFVYDEPTFPNDVLRGVIGTIAATLRAVRAGAGDAGLAASLMTAVALLNLVSHALSRRLYRAREF